MNSENHSDRNKKKKIPFSEKPLKGWDEALTSEEFLAESKRMIRRIYDEKNKKS